MAGPNGKNSIGISLIDICVFNSRLVNMLKCLRSHHQPSTKVFQASRHKTFHHYGSCIDTHAHFTQNAPKTKPNSVFSASKRCIQSTGISTNFSALAQEHSKYEANTLPKETRVVICGAGVIGGKSWLIIWLDFYFNQFYSFRLFLFTILSCGCLSLGYSRSRTWSCASRTR